MNNSCMLLLTIVYINFRNYFAIRNTKMQLVKYSSIVVFKEKHLFGNMENTCTNLQYPKCSQLFQKWFHYQKCSFYFCLGSPHLNPIHSDMIQYISTKQLLVVFCDFNPVIWLTQSLRRILHLSPDLAKTKLM